VIFLNKNLWKLLYAALVSIVSIVAISRFSGYKNIIEVFKLEKKLALMAFLIYISITIIDALRLKITLRFFKYHLSFFHSLKNIIVSVFFSILTPFSIGGQPVQVYHLSNLGVKAHDATSIVISRTIVVMFSTIIISFSFLYSVLKILPYDIHSVVLTGILISSVITTLMGIAFFNVGYADKLLKLLIFFLPKRKKEKIINKFNKSVLAYKTSMNTIWSKEKKIIIIDFIMYGIIAFLQPLSLYIPLKYLCHIDYNYFAVVGLFTILNTVAFYFPTPGSSGGIEGIYFLVLSRIINCSDVAKSILLWRLSSYYFPLLVGFVFSWNLKGKTTT